MITSSCDMWAIKHREAYNFFVKFHRNDLVCLDTNQMYEKQKALEFSCDLILIFESHPNIQELQQCWKNLSGYIPIRNILSLVQMAFQLSWAHISQ